VHFATLSGLPAETLMHLLVAPAQSAANADDPNQIDAEMDMAEIRIAGTRPRFSLSIFPSKKFHC
jgi:hypothetical protein